MKLTMTKRRGAKFKPKGLTDDDKLASGSCIKLMPNRKKRRRRTKTKIQEYYLAVIIMKTCTVILLLLLLPSIKSNVNQVVYSLTDAQAIGVIAKRSDPTLSDQNPSSMYHEDEKSLLSIGSNRTSSFQLDEDQQQQNRKQRKLIESIERSMQIHQPSEGSNFNHQLRKLLLSSPRHILSSFVPHSLTKQLVIKRPSNGHFMHLMKLRKFQEKLHNTSPNYKDMNKPPQLQQVANFNQYQMNHHHHVKSRDVELMSGQQSMSMSRFHQPLVTQPQMANNLLDSLQVSPLLLAAFRAQQQGPTMQLAPPTPRQIVVVNKLPATGSLRPKQQAEHPKLGNPVSALVMLQEPATSASFQQQLDHGANGNQQSSFVIESRPPEVGAVEMMDGAQTTNGQPHYPSVNKVASSYIPGQYGNRSEVERDLDHIDQLIRKELEARMNANEAERLAQLNRKQEQPNLLVSYVRNDSRSSEVERPPPQPKQENQQPESRWLQPTGTLNVAPASDPIAWRPAAGAKILGDNSLQQSTGNRTADGQSVGGRAVDSNREELDNNGDSGNDNGNEEEDGSSTGSAGNGDANGDDLTATNSSTDVETEETTGELADDDNDESQQLEQLARRPMGSSSLNMAAAADDNFLLAYNFSGPKLVLPARRRLQLWPTGDRLLPATTGNNQRQPQEQPFVPTALETIAQLRLNNNNNNNQHSGGENYPSQIHHNSAQNPNHLTTNGTTKSSLSQLNNGKAASHLGPIKLQARHHNFHQDRASDRQPDAASGSLKLKLPPPVAHNDDRWNSNRRHYNYHHLQNHAHRHLPNEPSGLAAGDGLSAASSPAPSTRAAASSSALRNSGLITSDATTSNRLVEGEDGSMSENDLLGETLRKLRETKARIRQLQAELNVSSPLELSAPSDELDMIDPLSGSLLLNRNRTTSGNMRDYELEAAGGSPIDGRRRSQFAPQQQPAGAATSADWFRSLRPHARTGSESPNRLVSPSIERLVYYSPQNPLTAPARLVASAFGRAAKSPPQQVASSGGSGGAWSAMVNEDSSGRPLTGDRQPLRSAAAAATDPSDNNGQGTMQAQVNGTSSEQPPSVVDSPLLSAKQQHQAAAADPDAQVQRGQQPPRLSNLRPALQQLRSRPATGDTFSTTLTSSSVVNGTGKPLAERKPPPGSTMGDDRRPPTEQSSSMRQLHYSSAAGDSALDPEAANSINLLAASAAGNSQLTTGFEPSKSKKPTTTEITDSIGQKQEATDRRSAGDLSSGHHPSSGGFLGHWLNKLLHLFSSGSALKPPITQQQQRRVNSSTGELSGMSSQVGDKLTTERVLHTLIALSCSLALLCLFVVIVTVRCQLKQQPPGGKQAKRGNHEARKKQPAEAEEQASRSSSEEPIVLHSGPSSGCSSAASTPRGSDHNHRRPIISSPPVAWHRRLLRASGRLLTGRDRSQLRAGAGGKRHKAAGERQLSTSGQEPSRDQLILDGTMMNVSMLARHSTEPKSLDNGAGLQQQSPIGIIQMFSKSRCQCGNCCPEASFLRGNQQEAGAIGSPNGSSEFNGGETGKHATSGGCRTLCSSGFYHPTSRSKLPFGAGSSLVDKAKPSDPLAQDSIEPRQPETRTSINDPSLAKSPTVGARGPIGGTRLRMMSAIDEGGDDDTVKPAGSLRDGQCTCRQCETPSINHYHYHRRVTPEAASLPLEEASTGRGCLCSQRLVQLKRSRGSTGIGKDDNPRIQGEDLDTDEGCDGDDNRDKGNLRPGSRGLHNPISGQLSKRNCSDSRRDAQDNNGAGKLAPSQALQRGNSVLALASSELGDCSACSSAKHTVANCESKISNSNNNQASGFCKLHASGRQQQPAGCGAIATGKTANTAAKIERPDSASSAKMVLSPANNNSSNNVNLNRHNQHHHNKAQNDQRLGDRIKVLARVREFNGSIPNRAEGQLNGAGDCCSPHRPAIESEELQRQPPDELRNQTRRGKQVLSLAANVHRKLKRSVAGPGRLLHPLDAGHDLERQSMSSKQPSKLANIQVVDGNNNHGSRSTAAT